MTIEKCRGLAAMARLPYFGMQNGMDCLAGSDLALATARGAGNCDIPCSGDSNQTCGGFVANSLYRTGRQSSLGGGHAAEGGRAAAGSMLVPWVLCQKMHAYPCCWAAACLTRWPYRPPSTGHQPSSYVGCYPSDAISSRHGAGLQLFPAAQGDAAMTIEKCRGMALALQLPYYGLMNGSACYVGMGREFGGRLNLSMCSMACAGGPNQACGGPSAISVYSTGVR
jgi:hypothetical protein